MKISGPDARSFLQGLISNDINKVSPSRAIYATFLTPQGRYLHDFFVAEVGGAFAVDCEAGRLDDLKRRLTMFKLRSKVEITDESERFLVAVIPEGVSGFDLGAAAGSAKEWEGGTVFVDAGKIWAGDVPYGEDTNWKTSVGVGLRTSFPAGGRSTYRLDFAWPLERGRGLGDFRVSLSLGEVIGHQARMPDIQIDRSRALGVAGNLFPFR